MVPILWPFSGDMEEWGGLTDDDVLMIINTLESIAALPEAEGVN